MAVRIRMKKLGRRHRPYFRICAMDSRAPRDGRVLEELGTYDPMVPDTDARVTLDHERVQHWLSVGALPTPKVQVLIRKYGPDGTHLAEQEQARERLSAGKPAVVFSSPAYEAGSAKAAAAPPPEAPPAEEPVEALPAEEAEAATAEEAAAEPAAEETPTEETAEATPAETAEAVPEESSEPPAEEAPAEEEKG